MTPSYFCDIYNAPPSPLPLHLNELNTISKLDTPRRGPPTTVSACELLVLIGNLPEEQSPTAHELLEG
jgi:hypothetical protein